MKQIYPPDSAYASCRICRDAMCDGHEPQEEREPEPRERELDDHQLYAETFGVTLQEAKL